MTTATSGIVLGNCPEDMESLRLLGLEFWTQGPWSPEDCLGVAEVLGIGASEARVKLFYVDTDAACVPIDVLTVGFAVQPYVNSEGQNLAGHFGVSWGEWDRNRGASRVALLEVKLACILVDMMQLRVASGDLIDSPGLVPCVHLGGAR